MADLLPCPFCGSEALFGEGLNYWFVHCVECLASTDMLMATGKKYEQDDAAELWNKRADPVQPNERSEPVEASAFIEAAVRFALTDAAQFIDTVKQDAVREGWWTEWDQQMRDKITAALVALVAPQPTARAVNTNVNECRSCGRMFVDGETCSRGGCPMGGDV